jgi:hypothetical protein
VTKSCRPIQISPRQGPAHMLRIPCTWEMGLGISRGILSSFPTSWDLILTPWCIMVCPFSIAVGCWLTRLRNGESLSGDGGLLSSHSSPRGHSRYRIFRIGAYFNPNHPILSGPLLGVEASHMVPGPHVATNNGGIYARLVCSWAPTKLIQSTSWNRACDLCLSYLPGSLGLAGPSTGGWEKEASHSIESDGMTDKRIKFSLL